MSEQVLKHKAIAVYLSAYSNDPDMVLLTESLAKEMVKSQYNLVFGGSGSGLMKVLADTVIENDCDVIGVSMQSLKQSAMSNLSTLIIADNLNERKRLLQEHAHAFIALPGGNGTLDEITQAIEERKQGFHSKPIVIINHAGFYDGLLQQYKTMEAKGFLPKNKVLEDFVVFVDSVHQAIEYIQHQK